MIWQLLGLCPSQHGVVIVQWNLQRWSTCIDTTVDRLLLRA
jgi:hypothetical protein